MGKLDILRKHHCKLATPEAESTYTPADVWAHHLRVEHEVASMVAHPSPDDPTLDAPMTSEEIETAVNKLKRYKSAGLDGIPGELLRAGGGYVIDMLTDLFRLVWQAERVPST